MVGFSETQPARSYLADFSMGKIVGISDSNTKQITNQTLLFVVVLFVLVYVYTQMPCYRCDTIGIYEGHCAIKG